jgi:hypothetical protein
VAVILRGCRSWEVVGVISDLVWVVMLELEQCCWPESCSALDVNSEHSSFRCDSIFELN